MIRAQVKRDKVTGERDAFAKAIGAELKRSGNVVLFAGDAYGVKQILNDKDPSLEIMMGRPKGPSTMDAKID